MNRPCSSGLRLQRRQKLFPIWKLTARPDVAKQDFDVGGHFFFTPLSGSPCSALFTARAAQFPRRCSRRTASAAVRAPRGVGATRDFGSHQPRTPVAALWPAKGRLFRVGAGGTTVPPSSPAYGRPTRDHSGFKPREGDALGSGCDSG